MAESNFEPRLSRYQSDDEIKAIVKNARSRCACFWLHVVNVSGTGLGISYKGRGHVPFAVNDDLHLTIDTSCIVFRRPIHITVNVRWREEAAVMDLKSGLHKTFLGCKITLIDPIHILVWNEGLQKLAEMETSDGADSLMQRLAVNG